MPFMFYRGISEDDIRAIIAYLHAQPAVTCSAQVRVPDKTPAQLWPADYSQGNGAFAQGHGQLWRLSGGAAGPLYALPHATG